MSNLLIKNVNVVDAFQNFHGDVYIENGIIKEVGQGLNKDSVEIIDGNNLTLMPSFIDTHAHFREPGFTQKEDIESGSKAAAKGGYTGVCLMANTWPVCSNYEVLNAVRNRAKEVGLTDIHQCVSITENFKGSNIEHLDMFKDLENIVKKLEDGNLTLDQSLEEFQKGIEAYKNCNDMLNKVEGKVKLIVEENSDIEIFDFKSLDI